MKSALQDLQSSFETTEENIETYINTMKFDMTPKLDSALTQWPAGSNPSYNPKQRNEVEINNGWIRSIIRFKRKKDYRIFFNLRCTANLIKDLHLYLDIDLGLHHTIH